jgi:hypothetical protein
MLTADLTVLDNHAGLTLQGSLGSKVYAQVAALLANSTLRRIAATASTTPQELTIGHSFTGGTGFKQRIRSVVRTSYRKVDQDTTLTDGVIPSMSTQLVIDRPVQSAGAITDTITINTLMALIDVVLTSGQLAKLLNQEM